MFPGTTRTDLEELSHRRIGPEYVLVLWLRVESLPFRPNSSKEAQCDVLSLPS